MEDDRTPTFSHLNRARSDNPFDKITEAIEEGIAPRKWPYTPQGVPALIPVPSLRNDDVPRAGELSSRVFNDLTEKIIVELRETVEAQLTDAVGRRAHALTQMEVLRQELDTAFNEHEAHVKEHHGKINDLAEAVKRKVEEDAKEMLALSQRLQEFADSINAAHERFFSA